MFLLNFLILFYVVSKKKNIYYLSYKNIRERWVAAKVDKSLGFFQFFVQFLVDFEFIPGEVKRIFLLSNLKGIFIVSTAPYWWILEELDPPRNLSESLRKLQKLPFKISSIKHQLSHIQFCKQPPTWSDCDHEIKNSNTSKLKKQETHQPTKQFPHPLVRWLKFSVSF